MFDKTKIGVIGLGYVGMPLYTELSRHFNVKGFDIDDKKVFGINATTDFRELLDINVIIVCVPTVVDGRGSFDIKPMKNVFENISKFASKGAHVIVESTISFEDLTSLSFDNNILNLGYSPERISPGETTIKDNPKLIATNNLETLGIMKKIYSKICDVQIIDDICDGVEIAVKAKLLENTQRAINISLMNELESNNPDLYQKIIDAASTKNNFIKYSPGLIGGQCIPMDHWFLNLKATSSYIKSSQQKLIDSIRIRIMNLAKNKTGRIICFGVGYKKNSCDIKYSNNYSFVQLLKSYNNNVFVYDPLCGIVEIDEFNPNDILIRLVDHDIFKPLDLKYDIVVN